MTVLSFVFPTFHAALPFENYVPLGHHQFNDAMAFLSAIDTPGDHYKITIDYLRVSFYVLTDSPTESFELHVERPKDIPISIFAIHSCSLDGKHRVVERTEPTFPLLWGLFTSNTGDLLFTTRCVVIPSGTLLTLLADSNTESLSTQDESESEAEEET